MCSAETGVKCFKYCKIVRIFSWMWQHGYKVKGVCVVGAFTATSC